MLHEGFYISYEYFEKGYDSKWWVYYIVFKTSLQGDKIPARDFTIFAKVPYITGNDRSISNWRRVVIYAMRFDIKYYYGILKGGKSYAKGQLEANYVDKSTNVQVVLNKITNGAFRNVAIFGKEIMKFNT